MASLSIADAKRAFLIAGIGNSAIVGPTDYLERYYFINVLASPKTTGSLADIKRAYYLGQGFSGSLDFMEYNYMKSKGAVGSSLANVRLSFYLTISPNPAPAFDAAVTKNPVATSGVTNWSHTCSGSAKLLLLFAFTSTAITSTAPTYNGVALSLVKRDNSLGSIITEIWALANPLSGTHTVAFVGNGQNAIACVSMSYTSFSTVSGVQAGHSFSGNVTLTTPSTNNSLVVSGAEASSAFTTQPGISRASGVLGGGLNWPFTVREQPGASPSTTQHYQATSSDILSALSASIP